MQKHRKTRNRKSVQLLQYYAVYVAVLVVRALPLRILKTVSLLLGNIMYSLLPKRRRIAIQNLRNAFNGTRNAIDIKSIARQSCTSFFLTALETIRFHFLQLEPYALGKLGYGSKEIEVLEGLFQKAKRIHDESKGCIFVTPHIGNWELLLHLSSKIGIPLAVVMRPLDNAYLEKLLYENRSIGGQVLIPKKNAFFQLQRVLRQGKSIAMLPDQSTKKGISVNFCGTKAETTPIPALLAIIHKRPIVVVACCRRAADGHFEGFVSDPLWPGAYESEKAEVFRLTEEMNSRMEVIIRKYPDQYLWVHNRWKIYADQKRGLFTGY